MAFAVRITGCPKAASAPPFELEPPWWPEKELREDPRFQPPSAGGGYLDYAADLSLPEFRALHERFRPRAGRGVFSWEDWQKIIRPMLAQLDLVSGPRADEFTRFRVVVFEWESGLGMDAKL